jgi:hypothetical protein
MAANKTLARTAIGVAILLWSAVAIAQPAATPPASSEFAAPDPTCIEWTNLCRVCKRSVRGTSTCSNVGVACQPEALRCIRYKVEDKDGKKKEDEKR